jgi:hypothetical protein
MGRGQQQQIRNSKSETNANAKQAGKPFQPGSFRISSRKVGLWFVSSFDIGISNFLGTFL